MISSPTILKPLLGALVLAAAGFAQAGVYTELLTAGGTKTINGGIYTQMAQQPTGTGYIDPFVRVGMQGSAGKDVVEAYNTTVNGVFNNSNEDTWNHAVTFGQLQILPGGPGGLGFVRFLLDINQNSGGAFNERLNLDDVQIFISTSPNQFTENLFVNGGKHGQVDLASSALVYRMDVPKITNPMNGLSTDNTVSLDYSLNSGSGSGDMYLDIPVSFFQAKFGNLGLTTLDQKNGAFIYLYSKFGSNPYENNDGFEEWAFLAPGSGGGFSGGVPEPSSLLLAGLGLLAVVGSRKRQRTTA